MSAPLYNAPILNHANQVSITYRAQAMGDHDRRATLQQVAQSSLDQALRQAIDIRSGFIQD